LGINQYWIERTVNSRWFGLADLVCVSISAALWYFLPQAAWRPLLIALLPWGVRVAAGRSPFRRTRLDLPLVIFLVTAAIGVWAAYDRDAAWTKFWLMVGAVLFYYALAGQPQANLWLVAGLLGFLGVLAACYFSMTHDWGTEPAKVEMINRVGLSWMSVRPSFHGEDIIHANDAASLMAMVTPFVVAFGLRSWRVRRVPLVLFAAAAGALILTGLLLTTSRGGWLAFGAAMGTWLLWGLSAYAARLIHWERSRIFALALLFVSSLSVWFALTYPGGIAGLADSLPGPASASSRLDLAPNTINLIADFPVTGGGLGAFPGLYSQYIDVIPFYVNDHSHNLFLDVAVEQGLLGLGAFLLVMLGSVWLLMAPPIRRESSTEWLDLLRWATLAGLIVMGLHGLVDDVLYGISGTPILFLLAGMAIAVAEPRPQQHSRWVQAAGQASTRAQVEGKRQWKIVGIAVVVIASIALLYSFRKPLLASWNADLGAVQMARTELAGWPTGEWDDGSNVAALVPTEGVFHQALRLDPGNRTAHHRLGLIAMLRRDFTTAVAHLERAYQADGDHRGIRKVLGYSYVWSGQLDHGLEVLANVPEARDEMAVYVWWWGIQGRNDLAAHAEEMVARMRYPW